MSTEKIPSSSLSEDLVGIQEKFNQIFEETAAKRILVLGSHEDAQKTINAQQKAVLTSIGFTSLQNVEEFHENERKLAEAGMRMNIIEYLKKVKTTYEKDIIGYNDLCALCEKYNVYFGPSDLFKGHMPMDNVKELNSFPFDKFNSTNSVVESKDGVSVVEGNLAYRATTMIVAPITSFSLKNVIISSSRELIKFSGYNSKYKSPCGEDPIVLLPFKPRESSEVFFLVLTHWDHSKSLI